MIKFLAAGLVLAAGLAMAPVAAAPIGAAAAEAEYRPGSGARVRQVRLAKRVKAKRHGESPLRQASRRGKAGYAQRRVPLPRERPSARPVSSADQIVAAPVAAPVARDEPVSMVVRPDASAPPSPSLGSRILRWLREH